MPTTLSDNIFAKCLPAISTDNERCGAITLCDVSPTTQDELASIYKDADGNWRVIGALLEADWMGKSCQIKQNGMYDWIMRNRRDWGSKRLTQSRINSGLMEIMPFVKMQRKGPINNEYWTVSSGTATPGTFDGDAYTHRFDVESQTSIPNDVRWFPERLRVHISGKAGDGVTATRTAWRVIGSEIVGGKIRLYTVSQNAGSFLDAAKLEVPATGVLVRGTPNVANPERYCPQIPGLNTNQLTPFFIETTRYGLCNGSLYQRYAEAIRQNNPLFRQFGDVPEVEYNRQVVEDWERRRAWDFWFTKPLENQTLADYDQLETLNYYSDDADGNYLYLPFEGQCFGRRANATGIYEQHAQCGRVKDLQNQILNIPELQVALYSMMRTRQSNGLESRIFEAHTDPFYATQLAQGFLRYFSYKSEGLLRLNQDISAKPEQGPLGFWFTKFSLEYPQIELRVVTHPFFADLADAHVNVFGANAAGPGRVLWIVEPSVNYKAMIASKTVINRSGTVEEIAKVNSVFSCVMEVPTQTQRLISVTDTNVAECPEADLFLENFSTDVPEHEKKSGDYEDLYGNYAGND